MNDFSTVDPLLTQQCVEFQQRTEAHLDEVRAKVREDWKRRQAIQPSAGVWLAPTLPERINRLNPSERHQLSRMIRSLKLRKIIKRTLAEAFWQREEQKTHDSMQQLRTMLRVRESLTSYENALTTFEPVYTRSSHGGGNDPPVVTRALEQSLLIQR